MSLGSVRRLPGNWIRRSHLFRRIDLVDGHIAGQLRLRGLLEELDVHCLAPDWHLEDLLAIWHRVAHTGTSALFVTTECLWEVCDACRATGFATVTFFSENRSCRWSRCQPAAPQRAS